MIKPSNLKGFTLIEMMVVVAVLGILIALTAFAQRGWQQNIEQRQVRSDLTMAATAMENAKNFGNGYPMGLPTTFKAASGVTLQFVWGDSTKYCLQASSKKLTSVVYFVDSSQGKEPKVGTCSASPYPPASPNPSAIAGSSSTINVTWSNVPGATSYVVRYGVGSPSTIASCTSSPCVLSGLAASTSYNISVAATNANGTSAAATTSATTQAPPVSPPASPTIASVNVTGPSAIVSWNSVSGAASYEVQTKVSTTGTWESAISKTSTSHQYNGLSLGVTYNYQVRAINAGGASAWSATVSRVTVPTPYNVNVSLDGGGYSCGNDGGTESWVNGTITWNGTSNTYAVRYEVSRARNNPSGFGSITNNYTGTGGGFSYAASSGGWWPPDYWNPYFSVTGIGPNGERSLEGGWTGPQYPPYAC